MAKKKAVKTEDELDELVDDILEDEEVEGIYPKLEKKEEDESIPPSVEEAIEEEELEFEIEEEPRFPDYKYLNLTLYRVQGENDYELMVEGQSHGFCNILVRHLLEIEGVNIAAYKVTGIVPAQIFIRLDKGKIKDILFGAIESLREEVIEVQKLFQKLT